MTEIEFAQSVSECGGRAFVVGGWVRDFLRHEVPQDKDYVVSGLSQADFENIFTEAKLIGRAFPVFLLDIDGKKCEVAMARKERKTGSGYHGFAADVSSSITIEDDLYRRDLTVNSMAIELLSGRVIDPYGGQADLTAKRLRPVSKHFVEDPVRALRGARFAAQLGFEPETDLITAMRACADELAREPAERILAELKKALAAAKPSLFFRTLQRADLLCLIFPEIHALIGKTQPERYHPEGDAFEHTMLILDETAAKTDNLIARFAALCHDLGKGVTPLEMLPHHYGHEKKGLDVLRHWNQRMTMPAQWLRAAGFIISEHMRAPRLAKAGKIADLLVAMEKVSEDIPIEDIKIIINADHHGLPPYLAQAEAGINVMHNITGRAAPPELKSEKIGAWVIKQKQMLCQQWLQTIDNATKNK